MTGQVNICSTTKQWETDYKNKDKVLAFFTAPWSGQAHKIAPIVRDLAREYPHVTVVQLDMRQFESMAKGMEVTAAPALVFMKSGKPVEKTEATKPYKLYERMEANFGQQIN